MLKKIIKLLTAVFLLSCFNLTSCRNDEVNKINILTGSFDTEFNAGHFENITTTQLDNLREAGKDFVVYVYTPGCLTCAEVDKKLEYYINNYGLTIYRIAYSALSSLDQLKMASSTAPILGFYKAGIKLEIVPYSKNEKHFDSQDSFNAMFEKYVLLPNYFFISPELLDTKIKNKETFVTLFTRSTCPDCSYLNTHFLNDYMARNKNKTFFLVECDIKGRRYSLDSTPENPQVDTTLWQNFKDKYQLSNTTSSEFGYDLGVVPTFQYYKDGILSGSDVYVNESFQEELISGHEENGQGVRYKFIVTQSFFDELVNTSYEFQTTYQEDTIQAQKNQFKKDCVIEVHDKKLSEFLNKYAKA